MAWCVLARAAWLATDPSPVTWCALARDFEAFKEMMLSYKQELAGGGPGFELQVRRAGRGCHAGG